MEKRGKRRKPSGRSERPQEHNVRQPDNEVSLSDDGPRTLNRVSILIDVRAHTQPRVHAHTLHIAMHTVPPKSLRR